MWQKMDRIMAGIGTVLSVISVGVVVILGILQVIFRFILKVSVPWTEEMMRALFIYIVFFGLILVERENGEVRTTMLIEKLPYKAYHVWESIVSLLSILFNVLVILIGGILSGVFTPTEGAAVASLYAFILTMIVYRETTWKDFLLILRDTAKESASIMFIVCASSLYGYLLTRTRLPNQFMNAIFTVTQNKYLILLLLNVFFLVIGCFMETNATLIILVPILTPMANALGIDLLHLGVMIVLNLMIGLLTPPVGMCLYATAKVADISLDRMIKAILPFYVPLIIALLLVTFVPGIVTWLPNALIH